MTALRRLRAAGVPVLLYGPPGTGKTCAGRGGVPGPDHRRRVTATPRSADLVGEYTQTPEGRYVFVHGPLVRAMREGRALLIDDATLIPPTVLAVLYPAMFLRGFAKTDGFSAGTHAWSGTAGAGCRGFDATQVSMTP